MRKFLGIVNLLSIKDIFLLLISTCAVSMYLGGTHFYLILICIAFISILKNKDSSCDINGLAFVILTVAFSSILYNYSDTSPIFKVEQRFVLLVFVIIAFSPAITNMRIYAYRKRLFYFLTIGLSIIGVMSALLSFVGFGYSGTYLLGLSDYPNSLGYTLGITIIFSFSILTQAKKWYVKLSCLCVIVLCYRTVPLTGTRTAFYSIPIFLIVYLFFSSKNWGDIIKKVLFFSIIIIAVLRTVNIDMSIINSKNEQQKDSNENSRTSLFYARQKEYEQSPIIGYGTFRGDPQYAVINKNGNVEVGNTFLAFLSMNGIVGFVNFILFYLSLIIPFLRYIFVRKKSGISSFEMLLLLVVVYNFISMQQMGLALNPGLYSSGFNWLTLGLIFKPNKYLNKYRNE